MMGIGRQLDDGAELAPAWSRRTALPGSFGGLMLCPIPLTGQGMGSVGSTQALYAMAYQQALAARRPTWYDWLRSVCRN
jgi:hypothetical protein